MTASPQNIPTQHQTYTPSLYHYTMRKQFPQGLEFFHEKNIVKPAGWEFPKTMVVIVRESPQNVRNIQVYES